MGLKCGMDGTLKSCHVKFRVRRRCFFLPLAPCKFKTTGFVFLPPRPIILHETGTIFGLCSSNLDMIGSHVYYYVDLFRNKKRVGHHDKQQGRPRRRKYAVNIPLQHLCVL